MKYHNARSARFVKELFDHHGYSSTKEDRDRAVYITQFPGCYGMAGCVITIEGSPPRGLIVVEYESLDRKKPRSICDVTPGQRNSKAIDWQIINQDRGRRWQFWSLVSSFLREVESTTEASTLIAHSTTSLGVH